MTTFASSLSKDVSTLLNVSLSRANGLVKAALDVLDINENGGEKSGENKQNNANDDISLKMKREAVMELAVSAHFDNSSSLEVNGASISVINVDINDEDMLKGGQNSEHLKNAADGKVEPSIVLAGKNEKDKACEAASSGIKTQQTIEPNLFFAPRMCQKPSGKFSTKNSTQSEQTRPEKETASMKKRLNSSNGDHKDLQPPSKRRKDQTNCSIIDPTDSSIPFNGCTSTASSTNENSQKLSTDSVVTSSSSSTQVVEVEVSDFLSPTFNAKSLAISYEGVLFPPFAHLAKALAAVCSTTKRLTKQRALTNILLAFLYHDRRILQSKGPQNEKSVYEESSVLVTTLLAGNVATEGLTLNIGHSSISNAICTALSCSPAKLRQSAGDAGEMGDAAANIFSGEGGKSFGGIKQQTRLAWAKPPKPLSIGDITDCLICIHNMGKDGAGKGIEKKRMNAMAKIFSAARNKQELRFAVKIFCGNIRTGATLVTVMSCLATATVLHKRRKEILGDEFYDSYLNLKEEIVHAQDDFRSVYARHHDLKKCVSCLVLGGFDSLKEHCNVVVGVPLQPMLASPCRGVEQAVSHYREFFSVENANKKESTPFFTAEYKYDGQRAQIHFQRSIGSCSKEGNPNVIIFSRHLESITPKFSQVVDWICSQTIPDELESFIVDAEICAVKRPKQISDDSVDAVLLPFQVLSTLKRDGNNDANASADDVGLCVFVYDIVLLNGKSLIDQALYERREILRNTFRRIIQPGRFEFAESVDISFKDDAENENPSAISRVDDFLLQSIGPGRCEGLMLKSLVSTYDAGGSREKGGGGGGWRKLKKDYVDSLADSIDVVPIGAWRGSGRKNKWFSPFLLAVYDSVTGDFQSLCRCMSGFSDEFYSEKYELFSSSSCILKEKPSNISTNENPPFWFDPCKSEVWEIRGADLTLSPVHHAAKGMIAVNSNYDVENGEDYSDRGIALRFPRFIRVRDDKNIKDATTNCDVLSLFNDQSQRR